MKSVLVTGANKGIGLAIVDAILREQPRYRVLLGSRDVYENRLVELSTWQQRASSAELAFLSAYLLHTDGKSSRAKVSVDFALQNMTDNPVVLVLQKAIDKTLNEKTENP